MSNHTNMSDYTNVGLSDMIIFIFMGTVYEQETKEEYKWIGKD